MAFLYNPFEQFEVVLLKTISIGSLDLSLTNLNLTLALITAVICSLFYIIRESRTFVPNNWQITFEAMYHFVFGVVSEQTGKKGFKYFPHLVSVFSLVLFSNLVGLTPFSFTVTSHIVVTFCLAFSYFLAWIIIGIIELRQKFLYVFCPRNMPLWLLPLLICVEFLSFALRPISLSVRLFANMLAGHILLHILAGAFIYLMTKMFLLTIPAYVIISAIGILELGIAFLQAYIFIVLLGIYLKDSLYAH